MALPKARVQLLDPETQAVISEVDVITDASTTLYENSTPTTRDFRGIKKGTTFDEDTSLKDVLDALLYPDLSPEIQTFRANTGEDIVEDITVYQEALQPIGGYTASLTVDVGSASSLEFTVNRTNLITGVVSVSMKDVSVIPGSIHTFQADIEAITEDTKISISVSDGKTIIESPSVIYKFVFPVYVGLATTYEGLLSDDPDVLDATKCNDYFNTLIRNKSPFISKRVCDLANQKGYAITDVLYQDMDVYPFVLYPNTWNKPVSISDVNGFDMISSYKYNSYVMIRTDNNLAVDTQYTLYINTRSHKANLATLSEISYNFISDRGSLDRIGEGIPIMNGFNILDDIPCDFRTVVDTYAQLSEIEYPYVGLITYVKETKSFFKYSSAKLWVPTNHDTYFIASSSAPSDTELGSWGDICINFTTGKFYQKSNVRWEEKGQIVGGGGGAPGPKGDPGQNATIDIVKVYTIDSTESARIVNIGTKTDARWEIYIPRGSNGLKGDKGDPGVKGEKGDPGSLASIRIGTVKPGTKFTVKNSGTSTAPVLDFTYPAAFDMISNYGSLYPTGAVFSTTNHSFDPNGTIPGEWVYIGNVTTTDPDGNKIVTDMYQNIEVKE